MKLRLLRSPITFLALCCSLLLFAAPIPCTTVAAPLDGPDSDGDGLDDALELVLGTHPAEPDPDGDGLSDFVETDGGLAAIDTDGDGVLDAWDVDSDDDTVWDAAEALFDTDNDGLPDYRDLDDDGDGIPTEVEAQWDHGDLDGVLNHQDLDSDNDGIADNGPGEGMLDSNSNGLPDFLDQYSPGWRDADGDLLHNDYESNYLGTNPNVRDTDGDGRTDHVETNGGNRIDTDGDGSIDALDDDSDNDGYGDIEEDGDCDSDGVPDFRDPDCPAGGEPDTDDDGVPDAVELALGTNPTDPDSDHDGRDDGVETNGGATIDTDADGLIDALDLDSDADQVSDVAERPGTTDSDADGLPDWRDPNDDDDGIPTEAEVQGPADPDQDGRPNYLDPDSDNDGPCDGCAGEGEADFNGNGIPDFLDKDWPQWLDADDDLLHDSYEISYLGTNRLKPDTDDDGRTDYVETDHGNLIDTDGDGEIDALDIDSDDDGYLDNDPQEADDCDRDGVTDYRDPDSPAGCSEPDADNDGVPDAVELALGTDPADPDTDHDGRNDGLETADGQNAVDTDGDGWIDALDTDSDNDEVNDRDELPGLSDSDEDGIPDWRDDDDDGDNLSTLYEGQGDVDGDGIPNFLDWDSDDDGYPDFAELIGGSDPYDPLSVPPVPHLPGISRVTDVGNDQGRRVRVRWTRSDLDPADPTSPETSALIASYSIYRRVDDAKAAAPGLVAHQEAAGLWDFVLNVPAALQPEYSALAGTLCDSTAAGICWSVFFVRAHTASPAVFYDSAPDSGYSIDNLAPGVPAGLAVAYGGANRLNWLPSGDADFRYFRVYRGDHAAFEPAPAMLVGSTAGTAFTDPAAGTGVHYAITAVDFAGNESPAARPASVSGVGDGMPGLSALRCAPNPFNPRTTIRFGLGTPATVRLVVFDVAGRLVRTLVAADLPAGTHEFDWDGCDAAGRAMGSGSYLARLVAGERNETVRLGLLR